MAHKKGLGSSRNGRDFERTASRSEGLRWPGGHRWIDPGTAAWTQFKPGENVGWGKDDTLFAKIPGTSSSATAAGSAVHLHQSGIVVFIDEVVIRVMAGDGGNGCLAFRREKHVPRGGPSGGTAGAARCHAGSQRALQHPPAFPLQSGTQGRARPPRGRQQPDGTRRRLDRSSCPGGTVVYDADTGELLHDFTQDGDRFLVAHGGKGGRGNARFAIPPTRRPPSTSPGVPAINGGCASS